MEATEKFIAALSNTMPLPDVYRRTRALLDNPNASISDFENLLQSDTLLTASIVSFANSAFFDFDHKVANLNRAIDIIGFGQLHDVILASLCVRTFSDQSDHSLPLKDFWRRAITRGIAARRLAQYCRLPANERYFTIGLLLEIGHAAMLAKEPALTLRSLQESQREQASLVAIERKHFGFDYCQLGAAILRQWHLHPLYQQVVENYLTPHEAKPELRNEIEIAYLAHHFCIPSAGFVDLKSSLLNHHEQLRAQEFVTNAIAAHLDEVCGILNLSIQN